MKSLNELIWEPEDLELDDDTVVVYAVGAGACVEANCGGTYKPLYYQPCAG